ncbi:MAG: histone deacetylase family protein [Candidatus Bathyarchaeota archaeon]|jgi:acetoin utilization protein AcuC
MGSSAIVYHPDVKGYDFGPGHPFRGERFSRFMALLERHGIFNDTGICRVKPGPAENGLLSLAHSERYLRDVERYSERNTPLTPDTPLTPAIERAARLIVGASVRAGEMVVSGEVAVAEGVGGGLHHAGRGYGGGFCVYNDVAICTLNLLERLGLDRVMILDSDVHAGNGTMDIFYGDPKVLFVSVHQDPRTIYPSTGFIHQTGEGAGEGYTVNVPLPPGAGDGCMALFLDEVFIPLAEEYKPQIIIRNGGTDPHYLDGLGSLKLTFQGLWGIGAAVAEGSRTAGCGVVDLCCSGYNPSTVAEGWVSLLFGVLGRDNPSVDPQPLPPASEGALRETRRVIGRVKSELEGRWGVF